MQTETQYVFHKELEQRFKQLKKVLEGQKHQHAEELVAEALTKLRTDQQLHACCAISGKTVSAYSENKLLKKIKNCKVGSSTATVCFTLHERNEHGALGQGFEVTIDMELFVGSSRA